MQSSEKAVMGLQLSKSNPFAFQDKPGLTTKTIFKGFSGQPKGFLLLGGPLSSSFLEVIPKTLKHGGRECLLGELGER